MKKELKTLLLLVLIMSGIKVFDIVFSPNHIFTGRNAVFSPTEIFLVSILGIIGVKLSRKINLTEMWDERVSSKQRFLKSYVTGIGLGGIFVSVDSIFRIGDINVGWPLSPIFYLWGAISQEILTHYFPIVLLMWLFYGVIFKGRFSKQLYLIFSTLLSLVSALGMVSAFNNPNIPLNLNYSFVPIVIGGMVFAVEFSILQMLRKYGFISALFTRIGFYTVWHVLWPLLFY